MSRETRDRKRDSKTKETGLEILSLLQSLVYKTIKVQNTQVYLFGCGVYLR